MKTPWITYICPVCHVKKTEHEERYVPKCPACGDSVTMVVSYRTAGEPERSNETKKVIVFTGITKLNREPDVILEDLKGKLEGFVLVGYDKDGNEYTASTYADGGTALWLLERCKKKLLG